MFRIDFSGAKQIVSTLRGVADRLFHTVEGELYQAAVTIQNEMREEGKPIVYPVQWDSAKQRRAFFATNGFGRGIPTKRTGKTNSAWKAIRIENGAQVGNPLAHSRHVSGFKQSRIHRGRWKVFNVVVASVLFKLPAKIRERIVVTFKVEE